MIEEKININDIKSDTKIDDFLANYADAPMNVHKPEESSEPVDSKHSEPDEPMSISGEILSGTLFLTLIESFMPILIGILNEQFDNKKVDIKKLKLTAGQKKELSPICDEVVKHFNITGNPVMLLIGSLIGIYGINYMSLRNLE